MFTCRGSGRRWMSTMTTCHKPVTTAADPLVMLVAGSIRDSTGGWPRSERVNGQQLVRRSDDISPPGIPLMERPD